jgi:hypothetical protein
MKTENWLKITKIEADHLLTLIQHNEEEGWYWGHKSWYWNRSNKLKKKLVKICHEEDPNNRSRTKV